MSKATISNVVNESIEQIQAVSGQIWYVATDGKDTNTGKSPNKPFLTIGAGETACSSGDKVVVKSGTYTENVVIAGINGLSFHFEQVVKIDGAGTCLTVTASYCKITAIGELNIAPGAGQTGVLISGNFNYVCDVRVLAGGTGVSITGTGNTVRRIACGNQTVYGFNIIGDQTRGYNLNTKGIGATTGYYINATSNAGYLDGCTSVSHTSHGFHLTSGTLNWTMKNCSSGVDDGAKLDEGSNTWDDFSFDNVKHKELT